MARVNYLNNRDILKEIHKSKTTYCSYTNDDFADYDIILADYSLIHKSGLVDVKGADDTPDEEFTITKVQKKQVLKPNIEIARDNRAARLARAAYDQAILSGEKRKLDEFTIDPQTIPTTDIVFRIMSWDHVPLDDTKKGKKVTAYIDEDDAPILNEYDEPEDAKTTKYTKCNFPPFKHFMLTVDGNAYCVGKSHWKGPVDTGVFCKDHGKMTNKLAHMYIKLSERYGTRSNWRNYTYNDEMRGQALLQLSQIGLQFDESKSQNPFAYYTAAITNSFTRVLNIEKRNQNIRDDILEISGLNPSYTRQGMSSGGGDGGHYEE